MIFGDETGTMYIDKPVSEMSGAEVWAVFFQYLTDEEKRGKIIEIINREEGIAMALDTLVNITQDEIEYALMTSRLIGELDWRTDMAEAKREGIKEGRAETSLEIARKMKEMGETVEKIQIFTGLSTETINQL